MVSEFAQARKCDQPMHHFNVFWPCNLQLLQTCKKVIQFQALLATHWHNKFFFGQPLLATNSAASLHPDFGYIVCHMLDVDANCTACCHICHNKELNIDSLQVEWFNTQTSDCVFLPVLSCLWTHRCPSRLQTSWRVIWRLFRSGKASKLCFWKSK